MDRKYAAWFVASLTLMLAMCVCAAAEKKPQDRAASRSFYVVGYFTEDGARTTRYPVKAVESSGAARLLTHIDYAFGKVVNNRCEIANRAVALDQAYDAASSVDGTADPVGENKLRGTFHQLQELKRLHPELKVLLSLGGWGQSGGFTSAAQPENVQEFVRSCVDLFVKGRFTDGVIEPGIFDGIDIDWEYPVNGGVEPGQPADKTNFTAMMAELRRQLDAVQPGLLLTAALPAEEEYYSNFELEKIVPYVDFLSVMAYDLHWNSEPLTAFHSALFRDRKDKTDPRLRDRYGDYAVQGFLRAKVPAYKLVFGVPFYGKGWAGVDDVNHGLYQKAEGQAPTPGSYRDLKQLSNSADRHYFSKPVSCTLWNDRTFWSYDCPEAMRAKVNYIHRHHLSGVMFWELSHDTADSELLHILAGR